jgi:hypothetical protein
MVGDPDQREREGINLGKVCQLYRNDRLAKRSREDRERADGASAHGDPLATNR